MPLFAFSRRRRRDANTVNSARDAKPQQLGTPMTPLPPYRTHFRAKTFSEASLRSPSLTCASFQSDQTQVASKSELLGHALHLARLAVILDRAKVYTGAVRAYYDCCSLLGSVEPLLARVESDITQQISKSYKKRLASLSALAPISAGHTLQFPLNISPAPDYHADVSAESVQPTQLIELNHLCQFLCTLGHCAQIIRNLEAETQENQPKGRDCESLLSLSSEFEKLQEDITRFRAYYSNKELVNGAGSNVLYVLLGSFRRKIGNLMNSKHKQLIMFLLALFDIKLPSEYEAEIKPLPPQPLTIRKPDGRERPELPKSEQSPLTPGLKTKFATKIPEDLREAVRLAPVPIPRKSSKRQRNRDEARRRPAYTFEAGRGGHKPNGLTRGEPFYIP